MEHLWLQDNIGESNINALEYQKREREETRKRTI